MKFKTPMNDRARNWLIAATGGILVCGVAVMLQSSDTAMATPASGFNATDITKSTFERIRVLALTDSEGEDAKVKIIAKEPTDVYVVHNTVDVGGSSGWHSHPGPSVVLVKQGTATVYESDDPSCSPVSYPAGSGFIDAGGTHVHMVANHGSQPLLLVAFQIVPAGSPSRRIDAAKPSQCP
jgi:quercetin dioxygenase-like cupin family protein